MASLLPGFEYDIFISYRQNDNKYDGWVTEFVNNLNKELEATLKDKVNVYFDANPYDGLLETHSVNHSLEAKLKCLIFIPILSKTYCDAKGFAWNHEFLAFADLAKQDQFGINIKLNSGNVSSRVLPVRIHDLDPEDVKLAESYLGPIRSVDFIYHSPGVNRPLRPWDDDIIKNTKQLFYRDQINKVANAIDEIIRGIRKAADNKSREKTSPVLVEEKKRVVEKISRPKKTTKFSISSPILLSGASVIVLAAVAFAGVRWYLNKQNIDRAKFVLLPAVQKLVEENFRPPTQAYDLALEAMKFIPNDSSLIKFWSAAATTIPIETEPPGAEIFWKEYSKPEMRWRSAGTTPLKEASFPRPYLRIEIRKPGYQTIEYAGPWTYQRLGADIAKLKLDSTGSLPENMVRIPKKKTFMYIVGVESYGDRQVGEFLIDRFEVTNKQFKTFMDAGGYTDKSLWKVPFFSEGKVLTFEAAVEKFTDRTGRRGPANWEAGSYPDGQENHPVTGVSWYEAAAYAAFAGKQLPTIFHWSVVAETSRTEFIVPLSNFNGKGTVQVGSLPGFSSFGVYDIAGNAREWCLNEANDRSQRYTMGGGWNDPTYSFNDAYTQAAMDRSLTNGFRCIKELPGDSTLNDLKVKVTMAFRDYRRENPVDDKTFEIFRRQYAYDKIPLHDSVKLIREGEFYTLEKVSFDAGYNNERMQAYLYLPKNIKPPYQPILFFAGSADIYSRKFDLDAALLRLDFILKNGRAIVMPVFKGTHERHDELDSDLQDETVFYRDHVIMWRKDIGRTIDYLETRKDIQANNLGYLGWSWGGFMGGIMPAVERRIKAVVLNVGGMEMHKALPEADQINFLPRVTQPVLMLNGKHDMFFPVETSQKPMFDLLGTPAKDKKILVYESGHLVPRTDFVRETLIWFDEYLGAVDSR
ncbi:MAG TPA: SUMF1/EgtB/PvdO family nonheme iron enzyme [Chryseolinea sp.]|nr:SUMF1/EgtB/PvdO family nonheme iron enzyme [Chryseolinea sp.]